MAITLLILMQILQGIAIVAGAPLLTGWIRQTHAWMGNKSGAGILQPYRDIRKLFYKEPILADNASPLFHVVPYLYFSLMCLVALIVPVLFICMPLHKIADVIVLAGIFSLARIFLSLAAMDVGTAFGSMGARREMMLSFLAEPALLIVFLNVSLISRSTDLSSIVKAMHLEASTLNPSVAFAVVAFFMILLAENSRNPVDNPTTHLELTMIHGAVTLEYSGRYLALIEWASYLKLLNYFTIAIALFFPWGLDMTVSWAGLGMAFLFFIAKVFLMSVWLVVFEVISAKMRIFRVPEFLTIAFVLAMLGVLIQLIPLE
jgi:formate hydrogenlyase subunit 4